jgi:hypothetical protein
MAPLTKTIGSGTRSNERSPSGEANSVRLRAAADSQDHLVEIALDEDPSEPEVVTDEIDAVGDRVRRGFEPERLPQLGGGEVPRPEDTDPHGPSRELARGVGKDAAFGRGQGRADDLARLPGQVDPVVLEKGSFLAAAHLSFYI